MAGVSLAAGAAGLATGATGATAASQRADVCRALGVGESIAVGGERGNTTHPPSRRRPFYVVVVVVAVAVVVRTRIHGPCFPSRDVMSVNATAAIDGTSSAKTNASDGGHSDSAAVARR